MNVGQASAMQWKSSMKRWRRLNPVSQAVSWRKISSVYVVGRIEIDPVSYSSTLPTFPGGVQPQSQRPAYAPATLAVEDDGWTDNERVHRQSPICWINDDFSERETHYHRTRNIWFTASMAIHDIPRDQWMTIEYYYTLLARSPNVIPRKTLQLCFST